MRTPLSPEKELRRIKIYYYIVVVFCFILIGLLFLHFFLVYDDFIIHPKTQTPKISYDNLNPEQIKVVRGIIKEINPLYSQFAKEIIFTKNIEKYCENEECNELCSDGFCLGFNVRRTQTAVIEWQDDLHEMKGTVCHEILHNIIDSSYGNKIQLHLVVYDLESKEVCYK